jgi:hypothetical protein
MIVKIPRRHAAIRQKRRGGAQYISFDLDTEWGDKFRTGSGSFIAA